MKSCSDSFITGHFRKVFNCYIGTDIRPIINIEEIFPKYTEAISPSNRRNDYLKGKL